jgi:nitroimidazol reductase NimA-like FMN-containing flavoprotein (pyridoxamine 5'-phosphate oxidase superfamily)
MTRAVAVNDRGQLPVSECLQLLRSTRLARVAACVAGRLEVVPVTVSIHGDTITFRTTQDSALSKVLVGSPVLLEADGLHGEVAWSVSVQGLVRSIDDFPCSTQVLTVAMTARSIIGDRFAFHDPASWGWY